MEALSWLSNPSQDTKTYAKDLDGDGFNEQIIANSHAMYVFSSVGGRLIAWFDRDKSLILLQISGDVPPKRFI